MASSNLVVTNLWESFLRESSKRAHIPESTCIIVGDSFSGKKSMLASLAALSEDANSYHEIAKYNFFEIEESYFEGGTAKVGLWAMDEMLFDESQKIFEISQLLDKVIEKNLHVCRDSFA